jgi:ribosomal protein S18 acetylase RimI-like enzyme
VAIPDYNGNRAASFWGEKRLDVCVLDPARHPPHAERLLELQRSAYAREAALIGFDGIPPLREDLPALLAARLRWLGRFDGARLVGALAWEEHGPEVEIARLVVDPADARRGHAAALIDELEARHPGAPLAVMTGAANAPALALYRGRGFAVRRERRSRRGSRWPSSAGRRERSPGADRVGASGAAALRSSCRAGGGRRGRRRARAGRRPCRPRRGGRCGR